MITCAQLEAKLHRLRNELQHVPDDDTRQEILDQIDEINTQLENQGCLQPPSDQGDWSEVPGGGRTDAALAAVSNGIGLYLFGKGIQDQRVYMNSTKDGQNWSGWSEVPGDGHTDAPLGTVWAAPNQRGVLTGPSIDLFGKGIQDRGVYVNHFDGTNWSGWSEVPGGGHTDVALTGAVYGGPEYLFMKGLDQRIYVNGGLAGFNAWHEVPGNGRTDASLAVVYSGISLLARRVGFWREG